MSGAVLQKLAQEGVPPQAATPRSFARQRSKSSHRLHRQEGIARSTQGDELRFGEESLRIESSSRTWGSTSRSARREEKTITIATISTLLHEQRNQGEVLTTGNQLGSVGSLTQGSTTARVLSAPLLLKRPDRIRGEVTAQVQLREAHLPGESCRQWPTRPLYSSRLTWTASTTSTGTRRTGSTLQTRQRFWSPEARRRTRRGLRRRVRVN